MSGSDCLDPTNTKHGADSVCGVRFSSFWPLKVRSAGWIYSTCLMETLLELHLQILLNWRSSGSGKSLTLKLSVTLTFLCAQTESFNSGKTYLFASFSSALNTRLIISAYHTIKNEKQRKVTNFFSEFVIFQLNYEREDYKWSSDECISCYSCHWMTSVWKQLVLELGLKVVQQGCSLWNVGKCAFLCITQAFLKAKLSLYFLIFSLFVSDFQIISPHQTDRGATERLGCIVGFYLWLGEEVRGRLKGDAQSGAWR